MAEYSNATTSTSGETGDRGPDLVATAGCMILLTTISVTMRFISRYVSKKVSFWWDDWCALIAWALLIPLGAFLIDSVHYGVGQHETEITDSQFESLNLDIYIGEIFYNLGLTATKFSALFFYIRVFPWTRTWFRWSIYVGFFLCTGWAIAITFMGCFQCTPARKYWHWELPGHCLSTYSINMGTSIPNVVIDLFILLIPMPFLRGLDANLKQKVGVAIVFFAGYATLALSITRVVVSAQLTPEKIKDYPWNAVTFLEVVDLEPGIGLISVCLPAQIYLFRYFLTEICGLHWSTMASSLTTGKNTLKKAGKRRSEKVKSIIHGARWRNLSNATSNTSYQAEVYADVNRESYHREGIQGIQVQTDVTVRPSSWAPQFVALILGE